MKTPMKCCTICSEEFPRTIEYFHKDPSKPDGLYPQCKTCRNAIQRSRYVNNDYHKERTRRWQREHPEAGRENTRRWRENHPEKYKEGYTKSNRANGAQRMRRWRSANPLRSRASYAKSRIKRLSRGDNQHYAADDVDLMLRTQKHRCWWCGVKIKGNNFHVDHRIPLARGGSNELNNLCISCPTCNLAKAAKLPHEWNGRLL